MASQRNGKNLLVNLGKTKPDFHTEYTSQDFFPADIVFNRTEWIKPQNHMRFVLDEENFSLGGLSTGQYYYLPDFKLNMSSMVETEAELMEVITRIPKFEQFKCIVIE